MAVSKFSFIFIALIIASNYSPACGQATRTPVDFWLTFGQQLTSNVLNWLLNLDIIPDDLLNDISAPSLPAPTPASINPNQIRISFVNGQPVILPLNAVVPAAPAPLKPAPQPAPIDPTWQLWKVLFDLHSPPKPAPIIPAPLPHHNYIVATTPSPCHTTPKCPGGDCKPEKVRIVVVDDCKNHHESSESRSEESSEEIDVIVPRKKCPRCH
ncbi:unnamed protein product [Chironomus riparius]|uniref:Uncharacterized protein n=1 Tax=Chironomus riparius TaxID=315576 RepID=A0A9N9RMH3_9DIPT|nr:unnamed protein product [Chironomus riparius]